MEIIGILIVSVLAAQLLVNVVFYILDLQRNRRNVNSIEDIHREANRIQLRQTEIVETATRKNRTILEGYGEHLTRLNENDAALAKFVNNLYALLKGASNGSLTPEEVVKRIEETGVLPEDMGKEREKDDTV